METCFGGGGGGGRTIGVGGLCRDSDGQIMWIKEDYGEGEGDGDGDADADADGEVDADEDGEVEVDDGVYFIGAD